MTNDVKYAIQNYQYSAALRLFHPSADLASIAAVLPFTPDYCWKAGEPRMTPIGTPLAGRYDRSYWVSRIIARTDADVSGPLEDSLWRELGVLEPYMPFFHSFRSEGGMGQLDIDLHSTNYFGIELAPELIAKAADLRLGIGITVYTVRQNG